jgi:hypothetical protein
VHNLHHCRLPLHQSCHTHFQFRTIPMFVSFNVLCYVYYTNSLKFYFPNCNKSLVIVLHSTKHTLTKVVYWSKISFRTKFWIQYEVWLRPENIERLLCLYHGFCQSEGASQFAGLLLANIATVIKSWRLRWMGHVVRIEVRRDAYNFFF